MPSQHIEHPEDAGTMIADEPVASQPGTEPPFIEPGWSTRGALPYARLGHSAVFDSDRERMLVFGGNANDVWALELAGDRAGTWSQVAVRGGFPPVHSYSTTFILPSFADAAVYVPERQSMIVVLNPDGISEPAVWHSEVWELSFEGPEPAWSKLATLEAADAREIHSAAAVYDPRGQRVLMLGGMLHDSALWALELAGETPRWSRIASAPGEPDTFYNGHSLVLDPGRNRVLLIGGIPRRAALWALDLEQPVWELLDSDLQATASYLSAVAFDSRRDELVHIGGDQTEQTVTRYSFADDLWRHSEIPTKLIGASVVVDYPRDRLVVFGGMSHRNETWTFDLEAHVWQRLGSSTAPPPKRITECTLVYDPERDAVIAFGDYQGGATLSYPLAHDDPLASWQELPAGSAPQVSFSAAVFDPVSRSVIAFAGYALRESSQLSRLRSDDGAHWETIEVEGDVPPERSGHVMVYDSQHERAIVFGGARDTSYPPTADLADTWALSLGPTPAWTLLAPSGTRPPSGEGALGIYDSIGRRMIVRRGATTYALALDTEPSWSELETSGAHPGEVGSGAALYDPETHRMIVLKHEATGTGVFSLDLESLVWRKYCPDTITPAPHVEQPRISNAVLVPDGVFMAFDNATYRFDLSAPFCE